jgi:hypothetical protein
MYLTFAASSFEARWMRGCCFYAVQLLSLTGGGSMESPVMDTMMELDAANAYSIMSYTSVQVRAWAACYGACGNHAQHVSSACIKLPSNTQACALWEML